MLDLGLVLTAEDLAVVDRVCQHYGDRLQRAARDLGVCTEKDINKKQDAEEEEVGEKKKK